MTPRTVLPSVAPSATARFDRSGPHLTVHLSGELDMASAPGVSDAIAEHLEPDDQLLALDLSALTFCDSSGIALFYRLHRQTEDAGIRFDLCEPSPGVRSILQLCDASGVLSIRP